MKMIVKKLIILGCFALISISLLSQNNIEGTVYGSDINDTQPFANIVIRNAENDQLITGTAADIEGYFSIELKEGTYALTVSVVGYEPKIINPLIVDGYDINLDKIILDPKTLTLSEAVITAEKSHIQNKPGMQVLNVGKDIAGSGGNVTNLLKVIPSVEVSTSGDVSIRGNKNVKILINGKEVAYGIDPKMLLKQFPTSQVESIEVITNTSVKEDPESSGGIINITLKKNVSDGFHMGFSTEYGISPTQWNGGVFGNYSKNDMNYYFTYAYYNESYNMNYYSNRDYLNNNLFYQSIKQLGNGDYKVFGHLLTGGMDYTINKNSELNFEVIHNTFNEDWIFNQDYDYLLLNGLTEESLVKNDNLDDINFTDISLKFDNKVDSIRTLNILGKYAFGEFGGKRVIDDNSLSSLNTIKNKGRYEIGELKLDYTKQVFKKSAIESGLYFNILGFNFDLTTDGTINDNKSYTYLQQKYAGYFLYRYNIKDFSAGLGFRAEYYKSKTNEKSSVNNVKQDYLKIFPNVQLQYILSKDKDYQTLNFSYTTRIRRPSYEELNPATDYSDPLNISEGNPELKPEMINTFELSHYYLNGDSKLTTTLFGRITNDVIQRKAELIDDFRLKTSYINFSSRKSIGLESNLTLKPLKWWEFTPAFMVSNQWFGKKPDGSNPPNKEGILWNIKTNNSFKISKNISGQIQSQYYGKSVSAFYTRKPYYQINAGLELKLLKGLGKFGISVNDIFNTGGKEKYKFQEEGYVSDFIWHLENRNVKLSLSVFF